MKQADVVVGETYYTKVGNRLVKVTVIAMIATLRRYALGADPGVRVRFSVRTEAGNVLPKARTAAALRPVPRQGP